MNRRKILALLVIIILTFPSLTLALDQYGQINYLQWSKMDRADKVLYVRAWLDGMLMGITSGIAVAIGPDPANEKKLEVFTKHVMTELIKTFSRIDSHRLTRWVDVYYTIAIEKGKQLDQLPDPSVVLSIQFANQVLKGE